MKKLIARFPRDESVIAVVNIIDGTLKTMFSNVSKALANAGK